MKGKYLITTDSWFIAPDGLQYKAVWGETIILDDSFLGVKTNYKSSNWFAKVGTEDNHVIIAGCQIHYAVKANNEPSSNPVKDSSIVNGEIKDYTRQGYIYIAK